MRPFIILLIHPSHSSWLLPLTSRSMGSRLCTCCTTVSSAVRRNAACPIDNVLRSAAPPPPPPPEEPPPPPLPDSTYVLPSLVTTPPTPSFSQRTSDSGDGEAARAHVGERLGFLQEHGADERAGDGRQVARLKGAEQPGIVVDKKCIQGGRERRVGRHDVGAQRRCRVLLVILGGGPVTGGRLLLSLLLCRGGRRGCHLGRVRPQHADLVVALPDLEGAAGAEQAKVLVHHALLGDVGGGEAHVLDHDEVELVRRQRPGGLARVVAHEAPAHLAVRARRVRGREAAAGSHGPDVDAGEGDAGVALLGEVAVAHHAPEARAAADLEHTGRRLGSEAGRADGPAKDLY